MKLSKEEIYDRLVPALCPPYKQALDYFRDRTKNADSVVELGIGTGNIANTILGNTPTAKYIGFDICTESLEKARQKLQQYDCTLTHADFNSASLPTAQFFVSSLSIHHLEHEQQARLFEKIHYACTNFLHFELIAPQSKKEGEENNSYLKHHVGKIAGEMDLSSTDIWAMIEESRKHDKPMTIAEHISLHKSQGAELEILLQDHCFVMYQTRRK